MSPDRLSSGKGHRDENFPVASLLIRPCHRPLILSFYRFARTADDIADHPSASAEEKLQRLEKMRATLAGETNAAPEAAELRRLALERQITIQHGLDLLEAFRLDVTKLRYADWQELMTYCRYSAMPVGRFVLDVHGESRDTWPLSDSLCAALQVINHLQDCGKDYRDLNRVYLPLDHLSRARLSTDALTERSAGAALRGVIRDLAGSAASLLDRSRPFASQIRDRRLAAEVSVIQALAEDLLRRLVRFDPLCQRVHHTKAEAAGLTLSSLARSLVGRRFSRKPSFVAAKGR